MKKLKIKTLYVLAAVALIIGFSSNFAFAQCPGETTAQQIKCGANAGAGQNETNTPKKLNEIISSGLNIFSVIIGVVAVVMLMVGGLRYVTSAGDTNRVAAAKNTILYAIVGLIIVAFAQLIVRFVLSNTTKGTNSKSSSSQGYAKGQETALSG